MTPDQEPDSGSADGSSRLVFTVGELGGIDGLRTLLLAQLRVLAESGSHCLVVELLDQPGVYVQTIVTPVGIRIESVGRGYLADSGHELSGDQMLTLVTLGWLAPPEPVDDPDPAWPRNWWREVAGPRHFERAVLQLVTTLEVLGIDDDAAMAIETFAATSQDWQWEPDPTHPCGGRLVTAAAH